MTKKKTNNLSQLNTKKVTYNILKPYGLYFFVEIFSIRNVKDTVRIAHTTCGTTRETPRKSPDYPPQFSVFFGFNTGGLK